MSDVIKTHRQARDLKAGERFQFVDHPTIYIRVCNVTSGEFDVDYVDTESWYVHGCAGDLAVRPQLTAKLTANQLLAAQSRITELEQEIKRLQLFERCCESMAAQFICPRMTAVELAEMQLRGRT